MESATEVHKDELVEISDSESDDTRFGGEDNSKEVASSSTTPSALAGYSAGVAKNLEKPDLSPQQVEDAKIWGVQGQSEV